jgi:hypothetical protein
MGPKGDPVSDSVPRLDTGRFSHVALCTEPGFVVQARFHVKGDKGGDSSGLRRDSFAFLPALERPLFAGRPTDEQRALSAAKRANGVFSQLESAGRDSDFSLVKLFLVSAALHVFGPGCIHDPNGEDARHAVIRAAQANELGDAFFCSEFVAMAFEQSYVLRDFLPGEQAPEPPLPEKKTDLLGRIFGIEPHIARHWFAQAMTTVESTFGLPVDEKTAAVIAAMAELELYDADFIDHRLEDLSELATKVVKNRVHDLLDAIKHHVFPEPVPPPPPLPWVPQLPLPLETPLPTSLVTPRMLEHATWLDFIEELQP